MDNATQRLTKAIQNSRAIRAVAAATVAEGVAFVERLRTRQLELTHRTGEMAWIAQFQLYRYTSLSQDELHGMTSEPS